MRALVASILCMLAAFGFGHPATVPSARIKVDATRSFEMRIRFDILAFALEQLSTDVSDTAMNALLDGPRDAFEDRIREAHQRFLEGFSISSGTSTVEFPTADQIIELATSSGKQRLPVMVSVVVRGRFRREDGSFTCRFPEILGAVIFTSEFPYQEPVTEPVEAGAESSRVHLPTSAEARETKMAVTAPLAPKPKAIEKNPIEAREPLVVSRVELPPVRTAAAPVAPVAQEVTRTHPLNPWVALGRYVKLGFRHILPEGLDHILFVLGLFLLSVRTKDLIKQITAFTVAHSLTLGLAVYGVVRLPSSIVEPLIAASIAFVAVENMVSKEMRAWRPIVVFGFGLVHGLGFAGGLKDIGLARRDFLSALVGFNVGVEVGQLTVVTVAILAVGWWSKSEKYRSYVITPASAAIAMIAIFWTFQRVLGV